MASMKDVPVKTRLIGFFLLVGVAPLLLTAIISLNKSSDALMVSAFDKLDAVQEIKLNQVEKYFDDRLGDAEVLAANPHTVTAMRDLVNANATIQSHGNYSGLGLLDQPAFESVYNEYFPAFNHYMTTYGYYDVFLIDPDQGDVLFTVAKESDFGTILSRENTGLSEAWDSCLRSGDPTLVDMAAYAPSNGAPAMFVATPIVDRGQTIGVLALQISNDAINGIMQERAGMGETGETYLVGSDMKMRSDSFLDPEGHCVEASMVGTVARNGVDTQAIRNALQGKSGSEIIVDYNGNPVLSVYSPLDLGNNITWVTVAEIDVAEVDEPIAALRMSMIILGLVLTALVLGISWLIAKSIAEPITNITEIAKEIALGDLNQDITIDQKDEIGDLATAFRELVEGLQSKASAAEAIAAGNLGVDIAVASQQDTLGKAMVAMRDQVNGLIDETKTLIQATRDGKLDIRGKDDNFDGAWKELVSGINDLIEAFVHPIRVTADYVDRISKGNVPDKITDEYKGDFNAIKNNLNNMIEVIGGLLEETTTLVEDSKNGKLGNRGDASKFEGDWAAMVSGINDILDAVIKPIQEAQGVLESMASNDLTDSVTGDYKGDHALIKNALNGSLVSLNDILSQVSVAIEQVSSGAGQVSSASQSLSQGATEQAASLEQISASIEEVGAQTKQNAENAAVANQLGEVAGKAASLGNEHMQQMLGAMTEISESSSQVQKIIKVIDEIAFQTNLLALNAAVEAARAGVHGKGFAVVAEEVRNLAQRSAKAASETTELIEGSVAKTENGGRIADDTAKALGEISDGVTKITDIIGEIDSASREQSIAINEVSQAVTQIDQVTQTNTANAEESAAASEELSGQANQLKEMISRFKLSGSKNNGRSNGSYEEASAHVAMPLSHDNALLSEDSQSNGGELAIELPDVEDSDFGNF